MITQYFNNIDMEFSGFELEKSLSKYRSMVNKITLYLMPMLTISFLSKSF